MQKSHETQPNPPRLNITLMGDSVSEITNLRARLEAKLGVRLSIAEVVRHLVSKAEI